MGCHLQKQPGRTEKTYCNNILTLPLRTRVLFEKATNTTQDECDRLEPSVVHWHPPSVSVYKMNSNTTIDRAKTGIGVGLVIRDHLGSVVASSSQRTEAGFSQQVKETVAILRVMMLVVDTGLIPTVIESDTLTVTLLTWWTLVFLTMLILAWSSPILGVAFIVVLLA
ncbi:hypothetical protein Ddye_021028 [Dipteronia dyeriana]|uniref:RNase H type-1 domain-containing protein n=1 Tax=Dipteronia dyeriana TaxID=168575 RepID=A0AAD9U1N4_9ROSI|nr:hypothetical protein Ddye_021028 [Dipteronia dyeriana]